MIDDNDDDDDDDDDDENQDDDDQPCHLHWSITSLIHFSLSKCFIKEADLGLEATFTIPLKLCIR